MTDSPASFGWPAPPPRLFARLYTTVAFLFTLAAVREVAAQGQGTGQVAGSYSWKYAGLLGLEIFLAVLLLIAFVFQSPPLDRRFSRLLEPVSRLLRRACAWNYLGVVAAWLIYIAVVYWQFARPFSGYNTRLWLFFLVAGVGAVFLWAARPKSSYFWSFVITFVLYGFGLKVLSYLPDVTAYPFTLGWSEASRYYYASLPYAGSLYGFSIPLSPWHPSRYLLLGLPFWIPGSPLLVHRLWQVILWLALSLLAGYVLARRVGIRSALLALVFSAWAALFLLQGPVYYHLLVCVILVLVGFDRRRFWKSLLFVVLASAWAGISRVNWIPVPAFLAVTLYLLERPWCEVPASPRGWWSYLWPPAVWGIAGGAAALLSQYAYVLVSGHADSSQFGSTFTSDLLWYRLFPSPTSGIGVLPEMLIVSLPLAIAVVLTWLRERAGWHWLRLLGMVLMVFILFAGGLVVSTKIGGGSNIHNVDAYLVLVLVLGVHILFNRARSEQESPVRAWLPWLLALVIAAVPVLWVLDLQPSFQRRDMQQAAADLTELQTQVQKYAAQGEVLFITQRQLQVFNLVPDVPLTADYELLTLSEMAISHNRAYLTRFTGDLANHRFALIVADTQRDNIQDPAVDAFAEENNAWVEEIARPILTYYQTELVLKGEDIHLYVPKP